MGFSYLNGQLWRDITREERSFCSSLYWQMEKDSAFFVKWLNQHTALDLDPNIEWEVGYEVCLYRDILKSQDQPIRNSSYSVKRTFDLCLFSEKNIIIIEAKVQQPFKGEQINMFRKDKGNIERLLNDRVVVNLIALASSVWISNHKKYSKSNLISAFDAIISWQHMSLLYNDQSFMRADSLYKK